MELSIPMAGSPHFSPAIVLFFFNKADHYWTLNNLFIFHFFEHPPRVAKLHALNHGPKPVTLNRDSSIS